MYKGWAYPSALMRAQTVQVSNDVKLDVRPSGIIQGASFLILSHLHQRHFSHKHFGLTCASPVLGPETAQAAHHSK